MANEYRIQRNFVQQSNSLQFKTVVINQNSASGDLRHSMSFWKEKTTATIPYLSTPGIGAWSTPVVQTFHTASKQIPEHPLNTVLLAIFVAPLDLTISYFTQGLLFFWTKKQRLFILAWKTTALEQISLYSIRKLTQRLLKLPTNLTPRNTNMSPKKGLCQ